MNFWNSKFYKEMYVGGVGKRCPAT
jgi:hypothetical protein